MTNPSHDILFTGGVPLDTVEDVFPTLAGAVGSRAYAYPDGEIGARSGWIFALNTATWPNAKGIEPMDSPVPDDHEFRVFDSYRLSEDVDAVHLEGLLPYSNAAIESYEVFRRLHDDGVVPPAVRFQIAFPTAHAGVTPWFPNADDWPVLFDAWTTALGDEHRRMLEVIPAEDLVVQLDYCTELQHMHNAIPSLPELTREEAFGRFTAKDYIGPHVAALPDEVALGYHICCGTWPRQPVVELDDIADPVEIANELSANSGRRVDYFHMPVMREAAESYFAPLSRLDIGDTPIYLGLECNDGRAAMDRRIDAARTAKRGFGVAHYCGYIWNLTELPRLLSDLLAGADHQREA